MNIKINPSSLCGELEAPASKSYAHRYITAAMLSDKKSRLQINTLSDDVLRTLSCVSALGGSYEISGKTVTITPINTSALGAVLDCGESGTTARIMLPLCAALSRDATICGSGRLPERPFSEMVTVLKEHGAKIDTDRLPIAVSGKISSGDYCIEGHISSQYITGLMFALSILDRGSRIILKTPLKSSAYVELTRSALKDYGAEIIKENYGYYVPSAVLIAPKDTIFVEGDWSNAAFWIVAAELGNDIRVTNLNSSSNQGDRLITALLGEREINVDEIPDLFPILAVLAAGRQGDTVLCGAGRLRIKESDRILSTQKLISSLGGSTRSGDDYLIIHGNGQLRGGTVDGCGDHRIVMAAAVAALICKESVTICGAEAVNKSYPTFFEDYKKLGGDVHVV